MVDINAFPIKTIPFNPADFAGVDGKEVELYVSPTHIQWRYVGDASYIDLVPLSDLTGPTGVGITSVVRTSGTGAAGTTDTYTITFDDASTTTFDVLNGADGAIGPEGPTGPEGPIGLTGADGTDAVWTEITQADYDALSPPNASTLYVIVG